MTVVELKNKVTRSVDGPRGRPLGDVGGGQFWSQRVPCPPARVVVHELGSRISITVEQDVVGRRRRLAPARARLHPYAANPDRGGVPEVSDRRAAHRWRGAVRCFARQLCLPHHAGVRNADGSDVPSVVGFASEQAVSTLAQQGFPAMIYGSGPVVTEQRPQRGQIVRNEQAAAYDAGQTVTLITGEPPSSG